MFEPDVYSSVFVRAAEIVGGMDRLAARIGVAPDLVETWARGEAIPPPDMFLRAVDIHVEASLKGLLTSVSGRRAGGTPAGDAS